MRLLFGLALSILLLGSVTGCSKGDTDSAVKTTETSTEAANAVPSSPHRVMVSLLDPSKQTREQQEYLLQLQNIILKAWTPGKSDKQCLLRIFADTSWLSSRNPPHQLLWQSAPH